MDLFTNDIKIKNPNDAKVANDFLEKYSMEKLQKASRLNYNALSDTIKDPLTRYITSDEFFERFRELNLMLEPIENSVKLEASVLKFDRTPLESYRNANNYLNINFSLFDAAFIYQNTLELTRIKNILKQEKYTTLLMNTYKYKMLWDFYKAINVTQDPKDIIYKIFILTNIVVTGTSELATSLSESDVSMIVHLMKQPPSLEFCKLWMDAHEFAYIIYNINDESCYMFKNNYYKNNLYIEFEFHSKQLTLLKHTYLKT
ncbi:hypothetical protein PmNV_043 [Penaeus monodon nudivirus]|uniref:Uncharacterized protein n=1 Tax=Penaeus monodon nudivirus TaxID=1529056 RepID=A0A076FIY5_9VIRU|nr:hypothetical protein PmNV_043 [Penaeus monodon nudivirus]AII15831.1 hypothetical protein PmNV_043 [Penaeus monodon nudivirus]